jgi:pyruvate/2-oxoglutarate dehydrogenase complex dihydrolipoamide acyltransferase (E2) component
MRFDVNRICELAGLGAASGGLMSEAAAAPAPAKAAPAAKAPPAAPAKPAAPAAKAAPAAPAAAKPVAEDDYADTDEGAGHYEGDHYEMGGAHGDIMDEEMYEIDEYALMEALVDMRQRRLEETNVRDAVREEIQRALRDRSGSWVYGSNKPTNSREGQVSRGGFGIGFGFHR